MVLKDMRLLKQIFGFWPWLFRVMGIFMRIKPWVTVCVVGVMTLGRATSFLALFLPIKILLLAGSDGVPRYFHPFVDSDAKMQWIAYMSLAAVMLYILTLVLDWTAERLAERASAAVLIENRKLNVLARQEYLAQSYFSRVCRFCACVVYSVLATMALLFVNFWLPALLSTVIMLELVLTAWSLAGREDGMRKGLQRFMLSRPGFYINMLVSVNTLLGFLFIVSPFLLSGGGNMIIALVSMLLTRQMLQQAGSAAGAAVALGKHRKRLNTLMFKGAPLESVDTRDHMLMHELFSVENRIQLVAEALSLAPESVVCVLEDSIIPGITTFRVMTVTGESQSHYQLQIHSAQSSNQLKNEDFLFAHIDRERVWAPELAAQFFLEGHECRLLTCGSKPLKGGMRRAWSERWYRRLWLCPLPAAVVEWYVATHPLLGHRLTVNRLAPITIALDTRADYVAYELICRQLSKIQERLEIMPLYITNKEAWAGNVMQSPDGASVRVMTWRRWRLEPLGAGLDPDMDVSRMAEYLEEVAKQRVDLSYIPTPGDIWFVNACWSLDKAISKGAYREAIRCLHKLVARLSL
jgi:hypothetical protein